MIVPDPAIILVSTTGFCTLRWCHIYFITCSIIIIMNQRSTNIGTAISISCNQSKQICCSKATVTDGPLLLESWQVLDFLNEVFKLIEIWE